LRESGLAIQCLAPGESIHTRKEQFETHAQAFARLLEVSFVTYRKLSLKEVTATLRRSIIALSNAANSVAGEHSSMTVTAKEKEAETWDRIREVLQKM
jgi:hypothetical protein